MSASTAHALDHLNSIRPNDGWSIQQQQQQDTSTIRLVRRNVPIVDNTFLDIHYDPTQKVIVGVMTTDGATCQVLVDGTTGRPIKDMQIVSCKSTYPKITTPPTKPKMQMKNNAPTPSSTAMGGGSSAATTGFQNLLSPLLDSLTPEDRIVVESYIKYALIAVGGAIVLSILSSWGGLLFFLLIPLLYAYAVSSCPPLDSFDAKKELKRVLRGYHLPENDRNKPKGLLEEWAARITASVTAEVATLPGYEIDMMSLAGAALWTTVIVPSVNLQCYWVGMNHKWYYIGSKEITPTTGGAGAGAGGGNNPYSAGPLPGRPIRQ
jgi:hypothetical protein